MTLDMLLVGDRGGEEGDAGGINSWRGAVGMLMRVLRLLVGVDGSLASASLSSAKGSGSFLVMMANIFSSWFNRFTPRRIFWSAITLRSRADG